MRVLVVGDLHGRWDGLWQALETEKPALVLCVGDWGDPGQVSRDGFERLLDRVPVHTVFGNHDDLALLQTLQNRDGTPVLLPHGIVLDRDGVRLAGINGIWAKSRRKPHYITAEEVAAIARQLAGQEVTVLLTHGCPIGLADETPKGTHGGQRCFLEAFRQVQPRLHLCGHLHRPQARQLKSGQWVINVGVTALGDYAVVDITPSQVTLLKQVTPSLRAAPSAWEGL
ncbi:3',5'-cyclic adenosine monophosphate phosphodiesterase CpdA [bacterium HR17]|uniref:3',5'-cyclic adenosine monophosphate phosphodiesterase CpdA n=1 Tax=Candidatus Fervidibacter japonicus TaxID=2035412 RepID=A0A2H5XDX9_9BACT|nr:3',5'-cyclic adenosine monophosphate phosphodiesterase CpdA [bacterium HR17]